MNIYIVMFATCGDESFRAFRQRDEAERYFYSLIGREYCSLIADFQHDEEKEMFLDNQNEVFEKFQITTEGNDLYCMIDDDTVYRMVETTIE